MKGKAETHRIDCISRYWLWRPTGSHRVERVYNCPIRAVCASTRVVCAPNMCNVHKRVKFSFYSNKLDSIALSLESLLANRRAKKTAPIRRLIDNNNTDNSLVNPQVNNITNNHDTSSNVTSPQSPNVTPARKRSRRKTKPANIQLDNSSVINLSSYSLSTDETSILSRRLTFCPTPRHIDWPEVSADIYDFSRRMRLTEYFFDNNSNTSNANKDDTPFRNKSTWNPPPPPPQRQRPST